MTVATPTRPSTPPTGSPGHESTPDGNLVRGDTAITPQGDRLPLPEDDLPPAVVDAEVALHETTGHGPGFFASIPPEIWLALGLALLVAVAWKGASRALTASLDGRAARIRADLEEAQALRQENEALLASYRRRQSEALAVADRILADARADAERLTRRAEADLMAAIERRRQQATDRIAQAEAQALADIRRAAARLAADTARDVARAQLASGGDAALFDRALADLPRHLH